MGDTPSKIFSDPQPLRTKCHNCQNDAHCASIKKYQNLKKQADCPGCGHNLSQIVLNYNMEKIGICDHTIETNHEINIKPNSIAERTIKFIKCSCTHSWHLLGGIKEDFECKKCQCHKCTKVTESLKNGLNDTVKDDEYSVYI